MEKEREIIYRPLGTWLNSNKEKCSWFNNTTKVNINVDATNCYRFIPAGTLLFQFTLPKDGNYIITDFYTACRNYAYVSKFLDTKIKFLFSWNAFLFEKDIICLEFFLHERINEKGEQLYSKLNDIISDNGCYNYVVPNLNYKIENEEEKDVKKADFFVFKYDKTKNVSSYPIAIIPFKEIYNNIMNFDKGQSITEFEKGILHMASEIYQDV